MLSMNASARARFQEIAKSWWVVCQRYGSGTSSTWTLYMERRMWGIGLLRSEVEVYCSLSMEGPDYAVILRAVEPRLGRVHGSGQTIFNNVSTKSMSDRDGMVHTSPSLNAQKYAPMPMM